MPALINLPQVKGGCVMVPTRDARLAEYSTNFNTRGVASPQTFDLSVQEMAQYTALHEAWMTSYNACKAEGGRSAALVASKDIAKSALLPVARELYAQIQNSLTVSDNNKLLMGVVIRKKQPTPMPPPALAPLLVLLSVTGTVGRYKASDASVQHGRRRPANAKGITILSFVGPSAPAANNPGWVLQGQQGRNIFEVDFGNEVPAGVGCWVTCMWYSPRGEYSPAAKPVQVYLPVGPVVETA
jgi:hypothetical protein